MCGCQDIYHSTASVGDWVLMFLGNKGSGFRRRAASPCSAHACGACGFVELHAINVDDEDNDLEKVVVAKDTSASPYR